MTADRETGSFQEAHSTGVVAGGSASCEMRVADLPRNTTQESCIFFQQNAGFTGLSCRAFRFNLWTKVASAGRNIGG